MGVLGGVRRKLEVVPDEHERGDVREEGKEDVRLEDGAGLVDD